MSDEQQIKSEIETVVIGRGHARFTAEEQEEIKYLVRRALYAHAGITPGRIAKGLRSAGFDVSRQLAEFYARQVQREDAAAERLRAEMPDLPAQRAEHRRRREAVFNHAMADGRYDAANRALDALAALDGLATSRQAVGIEGGAKAAGALDLGRMSDAELQAYRIALKEQRSQEPAPAAEAAE